jgi:predicted metalloendopeptidase
LVDSRGFKTIFSADTALLPVQCSRAITRNFVDGKFTLGENIGDLGGKMPRWLQPVVLKKMGWCQPAQSIATKLNRSKQYNFNPWMFIAKCDTFIRRLVFK